MRSPTAETIARRLRVKIDGRPDGRTRVVGYEHAVAGVPQRPARKFQSGRRSIITGQALRWRALGWDVEISFTPGKPVWKPFPATQEEAEQACREIVAERKLGYLRYRFILDRLDRARAEAS